MLIRLLALLAASSLSSPAAEARSCSPALPIAEEYSASSVVMIGRVLAITSQVREWPEPDVTGEPIKVMVRVATFEVERRWKGPTDHTVVVETCEQCTMGNRFELGERWVVFAGGEPASTGTCGRTLESSDPRYAATVQWLDARKPDALANIRMQPTRRVSPDGARLIRHR